MTRLTRLGLTGAILSVLASAAIAETCPLSYDQFEVGVPHTDMETCPDSMNAAGSYCRLSVVAEIATVFAFADETDCIVATKVYFEDDFDVRIP